ncbi:NAD(P)-binding protein [Aspergillus steynii IBT 23096]|uniref:NAD(P)-binding protein n=1 Tax=Aspergillus steynii IBT 23096 TaxID=1392250 RepID=A0A2I2FYS6_9EURO|nr:NAD(P)-binding protein [Aspergillus steynii IBT 23096]PLB45706.1 NAD(P)-binding protein [Aspergillus steynii IBT 23096]
MQLFRHTRPKGPTAVPTSSQKSCHLGAKPRILIIGAGYRGYSYAEPIHSSGEGIIAAVAEPSEFKRRAFGERFIWGTGKPLEGQAFTSWEDFISYEVNRRELERTTGTVTDPGIDAVFVCLLDELHATVVQAVAPLGLHILCEKPLATRLTDLLCIYGTLLKSWETLQTEAIFAAGLVLRHSLPQVMLRKLVREDRAVGDVISVEHTEAVGWKHFEHCYVRGPWRRESTSAPSLLTKSCHDIDFLFWLLCSPASTSSPEPPHLPSKVTSSGRLHFFRQANKPSGAGPATNCLSCPVETTCQYSAKSLYLHQHLRAGNRDRPVNAIVPDIEDVFRKQGLPSAAKRLLEVLGEDYDDETPASQVSRRNWYGRCVWESDNDVCDDQMVTIEWEDELLPFPQKQKSGSKRSSLLLKQQCYTGNLGTEPQYRPAKIAQFHMVALTDAISRRRGRISGTTGEIVYDAATIRVSDFCSGSEVVYNIPSAKGGHDGGDDGLALSFVRAVAKVKRGDMGVSEAQRTFLNCTVEELLRSHLAVFWVEEARIGGTALKWEEWWAREVETKLKGMGLGNF